MTDRAYISNISPAWPPMLQQTLLAARVPKWGHVSVYEDKLRPRALRDRDKEQLVERAQMVRPTGRRQGGLIHVAAIAVMAWRQADFRAVCEALAVRGDCIVAHADGKVFDLANPLALEAAVAHFPISRTESGRRKGRRVGAEAAAKAKLAASKADADKIRDRWGVDGYTATGLCREVGRSFQTMKRQLGLWEYARRKKERNAKRAALKEQANG